MLVDGHRRLEADKRFAADETDSTFSNLLLLRVVAKRKSFVNVDFKYTIFDTCYFRDCRFDSCNFIGCRFVGTNFHGARFTGCKFDYAIFEKTIVDPDILETECPGHENLKAKFARTLRTNFQQIGEAAAANRAMSIELQATEVHLYKSWRSTESYYRNKYKGLSRVRAFFGWSKFKVSKYVWGNGESALRLCVSVFILLCVMAAYDVTHFGDPNRIDNYILSLGNASGIFLGVLAPAAYARSYLAVVTLIRFVAIGLLLSIFVKKFNRR